MTTDIRLGLNFVKKLLRRVQVKHPKTGPSNAEPVPSDAELGPSDTEPGPSDAEPGQCEAEPS